MTLKGKLNHYNVKFLNNHCALLTLSIIFGILILSEPVFAQKVLTNPDITATTDKPSYIFGDTIVISGAVKTVLQGSVLTIQILDPYSNSVQTAQVAVAQDGSYKDAVMITGSMWKSSGVYTILVQYGSEVQTQTTFAFTATTTPINDTFQVKIPNSQQTFNVPYTIFGGSVTNMSVNASSLSLTVSILSVNYGTITLSLPRSLLDAKTSDGTDGPFTVLTDGNEITPQKEHVTSSDRTLTIQFLQGDKDIQIIGTIVASQNNSTINASSANLTTNQQSSAQITNMSKPITAVPEFPNGLTPFIVALITIVVLTRTMFRQIIRA
ncbi:MAG: PEFG-CTERM sorting domain-containing protein [Nitrosotalea sp.]